MCSRRSAVIARGPCVTSFDITAYRMSRCLIPGPGFSRYWLVRSLAEIADYIAVASADKESRRLQDYRAETDFASANTQWGDYLMDGACCSGDVQTLRVDTLNAVRMALAEAQ